MPFTAPSPRRLTNGTMPNVAPAAGGEWGWGGLGGVRAGWRACLARQQAGKTWQGLATRVGSRQSCLVARVGALHAPRCSNHGSCPWHGGTKSAPQHALQHAPQL